MITLTALISITDESRGSLSNATGNGGNNVSASLSDVVNDKKHGGKVFVLGASKLGSNDEYADAVPYYMGSVPSDENGDFSTDYSITISGANIVGFNILFDDTNKQFPRTLIVDGVESANSNAIFTIDDLVSANSHTVVISNWNTPNFPLKIQGIYITVDLYVGGANLVEIRRKIADRSTAESPCWGIIANSGSLSFTDIDDELKTYAERQLLTSGIDVLITLKNTLVEEKFEVVGDFTTDKWNYDNDSKKVSVSLKDDLVDWQSIQVPSYILQDEKTALELYEYLKEITEQNGWEFAPIDSDTYDILSSVVCPFPYMQSGSLWNEWQKLCEVCALYIYKNNNDAVVISTDIRS